MTFEDAENILRAAGFSVKRHPDASQAKDPNRAIDWYVVGAAIDPFVERLLGKVEVYVGLYPDSPGDYTIVKDVKGYFLIAQL